MNELEQYIRKDNLEINNMKINQNEKDEQVYDAILKVFIVGVLMLI